MNGPIFDPNRRQSYEFIQDGENVIVEIRVEPGGDGPAHIHPRQTERWTVLEGRVRLTIGRKRIVPEPGTPIVVPAGVRHAFKNIGERPARMRAEVQPGLGIQAFLTDAASLAQAGYYTRRGLPRSLAGARKMAAFLERHRETAVMLWPPRPLQRVLTTVLSARSLPDER